MEMVGIDSNLEKEKLASLERIANLPLKERLLAADVFAEQIYPHTTRISARGIEVPSQEENIARYKEGLEKKLQNIRYMHWIQHN